jgi:Peptidase family M28
VSMWDGPELGRRQALAALLGGAAWAAAGCSTGSSNGRSPGTTASAPAPAAGGLPHTDTMVGWIEDIVARGIRRPGYEADTWAEDFAIDRLREMGLDVHTEPVAVTRWEPVRWSLTVTPEGATPFELDCTPLPYAAPTGGIELDLVCHDPAAPSRSAGRAALVDARLVRLPADAVAGFGSVPDDPAGRVYDPDGTFAGEEHVLPHTSERNRIADHVFEAGAAAFVGTLLDHPADSHRYFVPYHGEPLPGPGVWISGSDGERLHHLLDQGSVRARLEVESTSEPFESRNVVAELPGADDDVVLVGSHHDGPWASAVEDGTGIALVLAQAAHWAAVPREQRPHRLRFVLHAGHMCGGAGHGAYVRAHADELERVVLAVHLEHAALDTVEEDGALVPGPCVPRWFFTSRIPELEATVSRAIETADLRRSMLVAPDALGSRPPTDAAGLHQLGVPVVQLLTAPWYLFDAADTIDKVDRHALVPIGQATIDIITSTAGTTATQMRAALGLSERPR